MHGCTCPADDLIGTATFDRSQRDRASPWRVEDWIPIYRRGKLTGKIQVIVEFDPDPPSGSDTGAFPNNR